MTANLPPMLPLPEPAGVMDITTDYVGYVGTFKVWTEHSVRAYAESERQQVAAAKDQEIARLTAERDALAARVAELQAGIYNEVCTLNSGPFDQPAMRSRLSKLLPAAPAQPEGENA